MQRRARRIALLTALAGAVVATVVLAARWDAIVARIVTSSALGDVESVRPRSEDDVEAARDALVAEWGPWFRKGVLDRDILLARLPTDGVTEAIWPPFLVLVAYLEANEERWESEEAALDEAALWLDPLAARPATRAFLVELLTNDFGAIAGWKRTTGFLSLGPRELTVLWKLAVATSLFSCREPPDREMIEGLRWDKSLDTVRRRLLARVQPSHWDALVRDATDPREKVRAGALLVLRHHPSRAVFELLAANALEDPSPLVRHAAAGVVALEGDRRGSRELLAGFFNERWERRWWSAACVSALGTPADIVLVALVATLDPDEIVRESFDDVRFSAAGDEIRDLAMRLTGGPRHALLFCERLLERPPRDVSE